MEINKGYTNELENMKIFPCQSFYQIELDVTRLKFFEDQERAN